MDPDRMDGKRQTTVERIRILLKPRPVGPGQCVQYHHRECSSPFHFREFWSLTEHGTEIPGS